tara:strand:+ start:4957 stop:5229 length:273 start_codon:yes stop_codon:yes gene_type:complete
MYLIRGINNIDLYRTRFANILTVATIGNFDGLHLGHQQILQTLQEEANRGDLKKLIILQNHMLKNFFLKQMVSNPLSHLEYFLGKRKLEK